MIHSFEDYRYIHLDEIDSTNSEARRMIADGLIDVPTVIAADKQTAGRGRQGKSFYSPAETGIYMSVVLQPECPMDAAVTLTTRVACAVAQAIEEITHVTVSIKWVNDIYIGSRKVCGILCEAVNDYETRTLKQVIIGVGVNIILSELPDEISNIAGALFERSSDIVLSEVRERLIRRIAERIGDPDGCGFPDFYRSRSNCIGHEITYIEAGVEHRAYVEDIDELGGLMIREKVTDNALKAENDLYLNRAEKDNNIDGEVYVRRTLTSGEISVRL